MNRVRTLVSRRRAQAVWGRAQTQDCIQWWGAVAGTAPAMAERPALWQHSRPEGGDQWTARHLP
ncbi:hypothetical protein KC218_25150, partial [Mycobacterium tuberculosis]|nr:hypothetical protein [Mycobacterium tuberculosis]